VSQGDGMLPNSQKVGISRRYAAWWR